MINGKNGSQNRRARSALVNGRRSVPWLTVAAVVVVVLFAAGVFGYAFLRSRANNAQAAALADFTPTAANQDPSTQIAGVQVVNYQGAQHVGPGEQVAYTQSPPLGGNHDQYWAACTGVVYDQPVRSENVVHSMEHGAVWITYNPDQVTGDVLGQLTRRAQAQPYTVLSPFPGLGQPIALQSWGHQLKLRDVIDARIDQFVAALRNNPNTHPESGASCQALGPGKFDPDQPPPFQPAPPVSASGQSGIRAETDAATPDRAPTAANPPTTPGS